MIPDFQESDSTLRTSRADAGQILHERALALARETEENLAASSTIDSIAFTLASESYAVEAVFVSQSFALTHLTRLPGAPSHILGMTSLRGAILPIIDLKELFGLPRRGLSDQNKVLVLQSDTMEFGILADSIHGLLSIPTDSLRQPPSMVSAAPRSFTKGVTAEGLIILDGHALLTDDTLVVKDSI
jgi:purine-binding chemotaxis protein CheW